MLLSSNIIYKHILPISILLTHLIYHGSDGFSTLARKQQKPNHKHTHFQNGLNVKAGIVAGSIFVTTMLQPHVVIASDPLVSATIDMADAAYPVLTMLGDTTFLANKLVKLGNKIATPKMALALDKGIEAFLAIPDESVTDFATKLKSSYADNNCASSISIPMAPIEQWSSSEAVQALDSTKVKALKDKFQVANQAVPQSTSTSESDGLKTKRICLPAAKEGLETLWLAQTELTLNVPRPEARAFTSSASAALQSIPGKDFLSVYPDAKKVFTSNADRKAVIKFEASAKSLEKVLQADTRFIQRMK